MKPFILDTNVALRFLLADDPAQSPKAKGLFELADAGQIRLHLSHVAIAELVWTLDSFFEFPRQDIGTKLRGLVLHDGIRVENQDVVLSALERFGRLTVDFPDCYAASLAAAQSCPVTSYDRDFRKFKDIICKTPDEILAETETDPKTSGLES
jgi:predicted nucleic-acid-binding protein